MKKCCLQRITQSDFEHDKKYMRISMLGTRGIPASYSGFETAVEELSTRLSQRGHIVTVYCRPHMIDYEGDVYKGVNLVKIRTIANKHLDTFVHTFLCSLHMIFKNRSHVALYFIAGNSPFCFISRLGLIPNAINVDGLDSHRQKWGKAAKIYLRFTERLAPISANEVISDSRVVQRYYQDRFGANSTFIPYGAKLDPAPGSNWLVKYGLKSREYILFVGRLVPENCAHVLIEAFKNVITNKKLVIVGDAPYAEEYIRELKKNSDDRVIFTGYVFGEGYRQLSQNSYLAAVPSVVGGTHPVIVEFMASGNCVVVSNHPPNLETIGEAGVSFDAEKGSADLESKLQHLIDNEEKVAEYRQKARERAEKEFDWERVTDQYETLCYRLAGKSINKQ